MNVAIIARTHLPLKLCWTAAIHKLQGQTLEMAVTEFGKRELFTGLTFLCLSRPEKIANLITEPMPFERLSKIRQSPVMAARITGKTRLK